MVLYNEYINTNNTSTYTNNINYIDYIIIYIYIKFTLFLL